MLTIALHAQDFLISALAMASTAGANAHFKSPQQSWASPDGWVRLRRPTAVRPTQSYVGFNTLVSPGWRLIWSAQDATPGCLVIRLALKVRPRWPEKTATEVFQVGVSRDPATIRSCLTYGLDGGSGGRQPDRVINGVRYAVWSNGDGGMSQHVNATDLRTVVSGACYAVERFSTSETASNGDPSVTLPQDQGSSELDATLASLRIGGASRTGTPEPEVRSRPATAAR